MFALTLLLAVAGAQPTVDRPAGNILATLRREHPRLIGLPDDLARVKKLIADDRRAAALYKEMLRSADKTLSAKPVEHRLIGPRLLDMSRKCLDRVYTLATVYRIDGDRRYAERAVREMLTAAEFDDWNPKHFLDTAEMTHALAIGYDWLYDFLSPDQRRQIRGAIVTKGLREAEKVYRRNTWWARSEYNWNQVCNGGISIGALAVAEDEPQLAAYILGRAVDSVPIAMKEYAPDGAWGEGPGYWNYATTYNVAMLAALESALGTDFGLSRTTGFSVTGDFRMQMIGPTKLAFNFADGHSGAGRAAAMYWLARKFDNPRYAWHERDFIEGTSALHLWWFDPRGIQPDDLPTDRWFRHVDVAFLRSKWHDPRALYVGFKGGDNKVNHSHLELGTFVLDADGQRWVLDLGSDDYNLPGYFGKLRWTYYRLGTQGQNTLLIDGKNQDPKAVAPIVAFHSSPDRAHVVADLSAAYAGQAKQVARGIALLDRRKVLVQDELVQVTGREVAWQVHTEAKIELQGSHAVLTQKGETLQARILAPADARFTIESADAPPPQHQQPNVRKLVVNLPPSQNTLRIAVLLTPGKEAVPAPAVVPLGSWTKQ